ncbi:peptidoglycan DD-metalloendopeptidase family protein [Patescibacteria group bacterium]|nr:peptidoglycan DD-metalloendopeptidase family protein [Patescibacteria group bacterium]MBU1705322.1 peptidoglycan DD-metalloendopeptidase family protein [Patescibacteria group bacterium]
MNSKAQKIGLICVLVAAGFLVSNFSVPGLYASSEGLVTEINTLKKEIEDRQSNIDHLNNRIDSYRQKIAEKQAESATLGGELELLENRIMKTELDILATEEEIDSVNAEIRLTDAEISLLQAQLDQDREILINIIQKIQVFDNDLSLQLLFGSDSFSELFDQLQHLENVNDDLTKTLERAKETQIQLVDNRTSQEGKKTRLTDLRKTLERSRQLSQEERVAKETILVETQQSEAQFSALLYSLRQEQAYIDQQIASLQNEIEKKLTANDTVGDSSVMSWPADPGYKGISATFHDPTYPYRHLFEHSGIDLPEPVGTPLKAAAPGYVAWTRTGASYGNYVMIIHTNGLATLYAHLSKIGVVPDQFVSRGEVIGATGGAAGAPGAGLSTGPHLHFEVRKNGIPVNPLDYLAY